MTERASGEAMTKAGTANKALAQEFHDRLKSELWRIAKLGEKPQRTWNEAVVRWLKEKSHKATVKGDVTALRWLDAFLGGKDLATISRATLDQIADEKLARGCSNATVNRTLALVRAILRKCVNEWEWLERAPQVRMFPEPTRRIRALTHEEAQRLLAELPEHLADMAAFSLATGLRASNVTGLQWQQVDLTFLGPTSTARYRVIEFGVIAYVGCGSPQAPARFRAARSGDTFRPFTWRDQTKRLMAVSQRRGADRSCQDAGHAGAGLLVRALLGV
jgi:integrase